MNRDLKELRRDYQAGELLEDDAGSDPLVLFARWLHDAQSTSQLEPNAMTLATVDGICLLYTSPSPRDATLSRMPSSA